MIDKIKNLKKFTDCSMPSDEGERMHIVGVAAYHRAIEDVVKVLAIYNTVSKLEDYDRLQHDYNCVLDNATCGRMSKSNYDLQTVYSVINEAQSELHYGIVKDDINELIENGASIDDIREYVNGL